MANNMDSDNLKKIFVGGLHPDTTDDSLASFYGQWGEVADSIVMRDNTTKRSRGFGFITFKDAYSVDECMRARPHTIDGKQVDPKRATPKEDAGNPAARKQVKKVFVGGIKDVTENADLMSYFSQFGPVASADIVIDKQTGRKRGFAFVTFEDADAVDKCVLVGHHSLNGNPCEVKKAMERGMEGAPSGRGGRGGPRGGGGYSQYGAPQGGYGGYGQGGYGASQGGYGSSGYGAGAGSWGGYAGYGDYSSEFGSGYGTSNGGGAMKNGGYAQRASGPYSAGGSYGGPPAGGAYAGYSSSYGGYGYGS